MELRTEIEIAAPTSAIWRVLTDLRHYGDWNPFIVGLQGQLEPNATLEVTLSLPDSNAEQRYRARVQKVEEEREIVWESQRFLKALLTTRHFFRLEPRDDHTRFVHGQDVSGMLLSSVLPRVTEATRGLVYMNQALKRRVESQSPS